MSIKDKLQIYIVTFNRMNKLKYTLDEILNSPVKDFDITVLDNASTDGTSELIDEYCQKYPNLKHIRHNINIGGNANICRAFEIGASCGKEYFWILCDDDKYDFSNWYEVEKRINAKDDIICVCDYICDNDEKKKDPAYQIFQLTFVPAGIYRSELITDDVLINMYDAIIMMFQQSVVTIKCVNENKKIHVLSKPIVFNGLHFIDRVNDESLSFKRGSDEKWVPEQRENTVWVLGFAKIITLLKDKNLQKRCMEISIPYKDIYNCWDNFYNHMKYTYINLGKINYFLEIYNVLPDEHKSYFNLANNFILEKNYKDLNAKFDSLTTIVNYKLDEITANTNKPSLLQQIFSVKNEEKHKVWRILGMKMKFRRGNNIRTTFNIGLYTIL